jgi:hypothetical protein
MNHTTLIFTISIIVVGIVTFAIWSNIHVYAQQLSSPSSSSAVGASTPPPAAPKPEQHIAKIKITSPSRGQQVPVGKDLTISGTSIDNATASTNNNDCKVSVIVNKVRPYQLATSATGTGSGGATDDYSEWNFVLTSKYTTIKPGQNRITAKYQCENNAALTAFSSLNVTGVQAATATTAAAAAAATATTAPAQITTKTAASTSNASAAPISSSSPIRSPQTTMATAAKSTTATASSSDPKQQQQHSSVSTNNNNPASASNGVAGTAVQTPVSNVGNKSLPAIIAPQVKLAPQQNAMSQQHQIEHQPATDNRNQNFLMSSTSSESNVKPLSKLASSETQANESSSFTSASRGPTENASSTNLLSVSVKVGKDPVTTGNKQNIIVSVSDARSNEKVAGAKVIGQVMKSSGLSKKGFEINTDDNGQVSYSWKIKQNAGTVGTYRVAVTVLAPGYQEKMATTSFKVKPSALFSISSITSLDRNNDVNNNNNLLTNHVHEFTNKILDDVKQGLNNKWTPRNFILPIPF